VRGLLARLGRGVEVVVHPHRLPRPGLRLLREAPHGGPVLLRRDTHQIETPALRNEDPESHGASLGHATPATSTRARAALSATRAPAAGRARRGRRAC